MGVPVGTLRERERGRQRERQRDRESAFLNKPFGFPLAVFPRKEDSFQLHECKGQSFKGS